MRTFNAEISSCWELLPTLLRIVVMGMMEAFFSFFKKQGPKYANIIVFRWRIKGFVCNGCVCNVNCRHCMNKCSFIYRYVSWINHFRSILWEISIEFSVIYQKTSYQIWVNLISNKCLLQIKKFNHLTTALISILSNRNIFQIISSSFKDYLHFFLKLWNFYPGLLLRLNFILLWLFREEYWIW